MNGEHASPQHCQDRRSSDPPDADPVSDRLLHRHPGDGHRLSCRTSTRAGPPHLDWLLGIGLVDGRAGRCRRAHRLSWATTHPRGSATRLKHMLANVAAVVLELVNLVLRLDNDDFIRVDRDLYFSRRGADPALQRLEGRRSRVPARHRRARRRTSSRLGLDRRVSAPTAALRSSTRSIRSHGKKSPSGLRPKWP